MILLAVQTGLRFGELIALRWEDVNLREGLLIVNRSIVRNIEGSPKNNKMRTLPLTSGVMNMLSNRLKVSEYVFYDQEGFPLKYNACLRNLHKICQIAGLRRISWHKLRHSFASHLASRSNSIVAIKELLGHSDIKTTMRYAHINLPVLKNTIESLESGFSFNGTIASQMQNLKYKPSTRLALELQNSLVKSNKLKNTNGRGAGN